MSEELIKRNNQWIWKTKEGELIKLTDLQDSHLRNIALFLMEFGYTECIASTDTRIKWLMVLQQEWKKRKKYMQ
jgi:hypothetical protein